MNTIHALCFLSSYFQSIYAVVFKVSFQGSSVVKNLPANIGDAGDMGLILGLGKSHEEEMATHSSILA